MISRLRRPGGVLLAGALAASILAAAPAAYAIDGTVSGVVTGPDGDPIDSVVVDAYRLAGDSWSYFGDGYATTDQDGRYTLSLPPGDYRLGFADYHGGHVEEFFDDSPTVEDADTVTIGDGTSVNIDAELATASHITGWVTDPDGDELSSVRVRAYRQAFDEGVAYWESASSTYTGEFGDYDLGGLAPGAYRVEFEDRDEVAPVYAREFYQDQASVLAAEDITVGAAAVRSGINAQLAVESTISGTVTDVDDAPLADVDAYAYVQAGAEWDYAGYASTDADGSYTFNGLGKGTYRVQFEYEDGDAYLFEAYNDKGFFDDADDILVGTTATVGGIDAQLVDGEHDIVYVEGVTIPMISGTPRVGSTLTVTAGTWSPADITATYQWFRGEQPVTGATASTYALTAADQGQVMFVLVTASKAGYEDRVNMSNAVGPIEAAPVVTPPVVAPPVVTPTPVPAPAPAPVISFSKKIDVAGALKVGSTLKLKNFKARVSRAAVSYKIQWYSGAKKIKKATTSKLKVTRALKGKLISVKVSATSGATTRTVKVKVGRIR